MSTYRIITPRVRTQCFVCKSVAFFAPLEGLYVCGTCAEYEGDCSCSKKAE